MDSLSLPILIAAAVALLVFGLAMALSGLLNTEKRKLQTRLAAEAKLRGGGGNNPLPLSITRNDDEASGASAFMVRWRPFEGLHRMVVQAYPNMNVTLFMCIVGTCALGGFIILSSATNNLVIACVALVLGAYFPFLLLMQKRSRRQRTIALQLPEALDFLSRLLQA